MIMKLKLTLALFFVFLPASSGFASTYTKEFERVDGFHRVTINIQEGNSDDLKNAIITASEYVDDKKIWSLIDYINKCPLDISMDLIKDSFEIKKINGSFDTVLFSYTIGCVGGLDPVDVKYFAYENGVKHSLRGEERIITPDGVIDNKVKPVPDANLRDNICLFQYMSKNWLKASTVAWE